MINRARTADKPDAFDVAGLEKSINDSAVRVSTIWVTYLIFALYLVIAAGTITDRQLLLRDPVKLPVLNIDLPLWGFFFVTPILFVIFHAYVLLQVLLLGRTAAAYNEAVDRTIPPPPANATVRQRLANTLFAQIFAGSPREREGALGGLLKLMAWATLAVAPVLVLLVFEFRFLPYHSHLATWTHRLLIFAELVTIFLIWPLVLNPTRDIEWRLIARHPLAWTAMPLFFVIAVFLASFPGEPHINALTGNSISTVQCQRGFWAKFDRLDLTREDMVDDEVLGKIEHTTAAKGLQPSQGERTRNFRERNLNCGIFKSADLRRVDLSDVFASGAIFDSAELGGASLDRAQLQDASLEDARLQEASLTGTRLRGASLNRAQLQGASLNRALSFKARHSTVRSSMVPRLSTHSFRAPPCGLRGFRLRPLAGQNLCSQRATGEHNSRERLLITLTFKVRYSTVPYFKVPRSRARASMAHGSRVHSFRAPT